MKIRPLYGASCNTYGLIPKCECVRPTTAASTKCLTKNTRTVNRGNIIHLLNGGYTDDAVSDGDALLHWDHVFVHVGPSDLQERQEGQE
jgi:hypothetical protein